MLDREQRLNEVYNYLHDHHGIHSKGDFADIIGYARAYVSSALNGNKKYLTDSLFQNVYKSFPGMFDLNYLLKGEGSLLTPEEEDAMEAAKVMSNQSDINQTIKNILEMQKIAVSALERQNEELKQRYQKELEEKDARIAELKKHILHLETLLQKYEAEEITKNYPFTQGVSDNKNEHTRV